MWLNRAKKCEPDFRRSMQDSAARAVILQLEEESESGDLEAIEEGRRQFANGDYATFRATKGPVRTG